MRRKITEDLKKWKKKKNRKPLVLTGVRQCGKTHIVNEFAKREFRKFHSLNLERNPQIGQVFERTRKHRTYLEICPSATRQRKQQVRL